MNEVIVHVEYCRTNEQKADIFTKPLGSRTRFQKKCSKYENEEQVWFTGGIVGNLNQIDLFKKRQQTLD